MGYLLGSDIGTTGVKTVLCDDSGAVVASTSAEYPCYNPRPLWSEQEPTDWWEGLCESVRAVLDEAGIDGEEVDGIGLSGQMHGLVMLDENDEVIRPAILWNDQRTGEECDEITDAVGEDRLMELVCNPALTGFTAPKILWVRKNEPANYEQCRRILLPKDYVRFRMSGEYATEVSDASGMLLLNVPEREWSDEVLDKLDIDREMLPRCHESAEVTASVSESAAEELGVTPGIPIVGGAGDQAAGAVGNGIVSHGVISATLGTSGVVFAFSDSPATDPEGRVHTFCHAVPGQWHVMGVMLSAGGSLHWVHDKLGEAERMRAEEEGRDSFDILTEEAAEAVPGSEGLFFLPYLTGERTPHANPNAKGAWIGLTPRHGKQEMVRSTMEGITFGMKDSLEIMRGMGVQMDQIRVSGGGAKSEFWCNMQADIYEQDVCTINTEQGPAYGVALLAGVGAERWDSVEEACSSAIRVTDSYEVDESKTETYRRLYPLWRQLYRDLEDSFDDITEAVEELYG